MFAILVLADQTNYEPWQGVREEVSYRCEKFRVSKKKDARMLKYFYSIFPLVLPSL